MICRAQAQQGAASYDYSTCELPAAMPMPTASQPQPTGTQGVRDNTIAALH